MKRVYVCSPLRSGRGFTTEDNITFAQKLCAIATRAGYAAFASHVFYPLFLDDKLEKERALGMEAGLAWLRVCDEVWVYAEEEAECSEGMLKEIAIAGKLSVAPTVIWMPPAWKHLTRVAAA